MVYAAELALATSADEELVARTRRILEILGPAPPPAKRADALAPAAEAIRRDKKARGNLRFIILDGLARPRLRCRTTQSQAMTLLEVSSKPESHAVTATRHDCQHMTVGIAAIGRGATASVVPC